MCAPNPWAELSMLWKDKIPPSSWSPCLILTLFPLALPLSFPALPRGLVVVGVGGTEDYFGILIHAQGTCLRQPGNQAQPTHTGSFEQYWV